MVQQTNRTRAVGIALTFGLALSLAACAVEEDGGNGGDNPSVEEWEPEFVDGELQPLPDGFPDQPITIVNADDPSSADGLYARIMQEIMNDGLSPVQVQIVDRPSNNYGTWEALLFAESEPGGDEGYVSIILNVPASALDFLTVDITGLTGLTLDDLNVVATTEEVPFLVYQRADAPWGDTFDDMIGYAKANPGEVCYLSLDPGSTVDITMQYLLDAEGVEVRQVVGGGSVEVAIAVAASECDIALTNVDSVFPHWQGGKIDPLLLTGQENIKPWLDVPTMTERLGGPNVLPGQVRGLAVPASVDDLHREWLAVLLATAAEDERYQARADAEPGRAVVTRSHDEGQQLAQDTFERIDPIVRELGLHWEDQ